MKFRAVLKSVLMLSAASLIISLTACESGGETDDYVWISEEEIMQAKQDCTDMIEAYCLALDDCDTYTGRDECEDDQASLIDCESAIDTTETYDGCIDELNDLDCEESTDYPESCTGVIIIGVEY